MSRIFLDTKADGGGVFPIDLNQKIRLAQFPEYTHILDIRDSLNLFFNLSGDPIQLMEVYLQRSSPHFPL